jgi:hydroxyacylglutathione hydrolase
VLVVGFPTGLFAANCYVVAPAPGEECVIVDPGQDVIGPLAAALREHKLKPAAVLLTHGHIDHMWSVVPVCGEHEIAAYVHPADRDRLDDPTRTLSADLVAALGVAGVTFGEPADVRELSDGGVLDLAGLALTAAHMPGHTAGSVVFRSGAGGPDGEPVAFTGDVLFAGSIGRSDQIGGDSDAMQQSLTRLLSWPDETLVMPGHGGSTSIGRERQSNPFLRELEHSRQATA